MIEIYGGENIELGLRVSCSVCFCYCYSCRVLELGCWPFFFLFNQVWMCGGTIEIIPCSKIAHIERAHKPYAPDLSKPMRRNALRVAEIWMDEYKRNVIVSWNLPLQVSVALSFIQTPICYNLVFA